MMNRVLPAPQVAANATSWRCGDRRIHGDPIIMPRYHCNMNTGADYRDPGSLSDSRWPMLRSRQSERAVPAQQPRFLPGARSRR
jgi:hypothetical protein